MVPIRFKFSGDKSIAKSYTGMGRKVLADLKISMRFQKLKTGIKEIRFNNGIIIKALMSYGVASVEIFIPLNKEEGKECILQCLCGCGIQTGRIAESPYSTYNTNTEKWEQDLDTIPQATDLYKISVCQLPLDLRKLKKDMHSLDFYPHKVTFNSYNKFFVVFESYEKNQVHDLSLINACVWNNFLLISLAYDGVPKCL